MSKRIIPSPALLGLALPPERPRARTSWLDRLSRVLSPTVQQSWPQAYERAAWLVVPAVLRPLGPLAASHYLAGGQGPLLRCLSVEAMPPGAIYELDLQLRSGEGSTPLVVRALADRPCPSGHEVIVALLGPS